MGTFICIWNATNEAFAARADYSKSMKINPLASGRGLRQAGSRREETFAPAEKLQQDGSVNLSRDELRRVLGISARADRVQFWGDWQRIPSGGPHSTIKRRDPFPA